MAQIQPIGVQGRPDLLEHHPGGILFSTLLLRQDEHHQCSGKKQDDDDDEQNFDQGEAPGARTSPAHGLESRNGHGQ